MCLAIVSLLRACPDARVAVYREFVHCSAKMRRIGSEVIQCGGALGYSLAHRLSGMFQPIPPLLHAISGKPWCVFHPKYTTIHSRWFTFYRRLLQETSPYVAEARRFRGELEMPCPWMDAWSLLGLALRLTGFGHYALRGLPLTLAATAAMAGRQLPREAAAVVRQAVSEGTMCSHQGSAIGLMGVRSSKGKAACAS